jgi:uncharacterized membrane protein YfcA
MKRHQIGTLIFELLFLAMPLAFIGGALNPAYKGGHLPLIVASITAGLLLVAMLRRLTTSPSGQQQEAGWGQSASEESTSEETVAPWFGFLVAIAYLGLFFGLVFVVGAYVAIPVFLLIFLRLHGKLSLTMNGLVVLVVGVGLPLIFRFIFNLELWLGAVPVAIRGWIGGGFVPPI